MEDKLKEKEQYNLDMHRMIYGDNSVYNKGECADNAKRGTLVSEETRKKMSLSR